MTDANKNRPEILSIKYGIGYFGLVVVLLDARRMRSTIATLPPDEREPHGKSSSVE